MLQIRQDVVIRENYKACFSRILEDGNIGERKFELQVRYDVFTDFNCRPKSFLLLHVAGNQNL
jgi:hypothetical protein